jgi:hypothetical protein
MDKTDLAASKPESIPAASEHGQIRPIHATHLVRSFKNTLSFPVVLVLVVVIVIVIEDHV